MFKIIPEPTFAIPVEISVPGRAEKGVLTVTYKHLTGKERAAFFDPAVTAGRKDYDLLSEIVVGWDGADRPYSPEALAALIDGYPRAAAEIVQAFVTALFGAAEKNSLTLPVPGQS